MVSKAPDKTFSGLNEEYMISEIRPQIGRYKLGLPHVTFTTPVMDAFCNGATLPGHELTQLSSKTFRCVHHFSTLHLHDCRANFYNKMVFTYLFPEARLV